MSKTLTGFLVGIFSGVLVYELVNRKNPDFIETIRKNLKKNIDDLGMLCQCNDEICEQPAVKSEADRYEEAYSYKGP
jgi:hypothetical protein